MYRTNTCGELRTKEINKEVTLSGWTNSRRDHGGVIFIDIRDRYGITQIVFDPSNNKDAHKIAESLSREDVLQVKGKVRHRGEGLVNSKLSTGEIEVLADELIILNKSQTPPIEVDDRKLAGEDTRFKYRYLDLRRPKAQADFEVRHRVVKAVRDYFDKNNFLELETPMLAKSTPEGARDYLVPSRVNKGLFYALPQSPQIFKQLFMVAGMDRYFQIVKCFRDEDLRADRQPEFTQIDVEMSFVEEEDIYVMIEGMVKHVMNECGIKVQIPFPRIEYTDAMDKYGSDKPDLRFGLELKNISNLAEKSGFSVFKDTIAAGGSVYCLNAENCAEFSRKDIDKLEEVARIYGAKGLAWMKHTGKLESSVTKFFSDDELNAIEKAASAKKGDLLLFVADKKLSVAQTALGQVRLALGKKLNLIKDEWNFAWVTSFPLLEYDEDEERYVSVHHPFTSPKMEDLHLLETSPEKVRSIAYDLTLNGFEIAGGSIRIHQSELQERMFKALGIPKDEAEKKFGFLMNAFKYGAPPHGGIAFGLDRLVMLITGNDSIKEIIAFPKNKNAEDLMMESPSEVYEDQLKELGIALRKKGK